MLAPDLPGHGKSGSKDVDTLNSLKSIIEIANQFGPVRTIVGHSLGTLLACLAANGHDAIGGRIEAERLALISGPESLASVIDGLGAAAGLSAEVVREIRDRTNSDFERDAGSGSRRSIYLTGWICRCWPFTTGRIHSLEYRPL